jgi:hypothetical protein
MSAVTDNPGRSIRLTCARSRITRLGVYPQSQHAINTDPGKPLVDESPDAGIATTADGKKV